MLPSKRCYQQPAFQLPSGSPLKWDGYLRLYPPNVLDQFLSYQRPSGKKDNILQAVLTLMLKSFNLLQMSFSEFEIWQFFPIHLSLDDLVDISD